MRTDLCGVKGFTLLELLLVVTVIAIVAALLLPALAGAKGKARQSACMNNLRQINLGVRMYADDSSDAFPAPKKNNGPPDAFIAYTKLMKGYLGMTSASSERVALFACPADTFHYDYNDRVAEGLHLQSRFCYSSYAFNGGNFPWKNAVPRWPGIAGRKLSSMKEPVKTVLVAEFAALLPYSWHQPAGASGHYNNAQNMVSFVDGHVRFIKMYWDAASVIAEHLEAWQYDPPPGYDYKWSGD
jgi:prepilin-type N-terminal cleavage/methylation domain-containing protein/prepilin-type processing-associated H-X9-DG protein